MHACLLPVESFTCAVWGASGNVIACMGERRQTCPTQTFVYVFDA